MLWSYLKNVTFYEIFVTLQFKVNLCINKIKYYKKIRSDRKFLQTFEKKISAVFKVQSTNTQHRLRTF